MGCLFRWERHFARAVSSVLMWYENMTCLWIVLAYSRTIDRIWRCLPPCNKEWCSAGNLSQSPTSACVCCWTRAHWAVRTSFPHPTKTPQCCDVIWCNCDVTTDHLLIERAADHGFNSRAVQIGHSVVTAAMFLRSCVVQGLNRGDGPTTRYMLRCNTTSIMKIWSWCRSNRNTKNIFTPTQFLLSQAPWPSIEPRSIDSSK